MFKKILYGVAGFGLGSFFLFNSIVCAYRFYTGYSQLLGPQEWLISSITTLLAGAFLIFFAQKVIRQMSLIYSLFFYSNKMGRQNLMPMSVYIVLTMNSFSTLQSLRQKADIPSN